MCSRVGYLGDQGDIHGRSCSWCGAMANGSCQFTLYPVSVAGRAGRVSQTRVRPWLAMGRQRSRRRVMVSRMVVPQVVLLY